MTQPSLARPNDGRTSPTASVASMTSPEPMAATAPLVSRPSVPREVACPICATQFDPRASGGRCPVCNEQVVPEADVTRTIPVLTPASKWLKAGGWRVVLLLVFVTYQLVLLIYLWATFASAHLV